MTTEDAQMAPDPLGPVERRMVRPLCYMAKEVAAKLKAKAPEVAPNYGATTTVTIAMAFKDDAPLYDQAALEAAVAAERERCAKVCAAAWEIDGTQTAAEFAALVRGA